jgi:hypothetical protein
MDGSVISRAYFDLSAWPGSAAQNHGMLGAWVRFESFGAAAAPDHVALVLSMSGRGGNFLGGIGIRQDGTLCGVAGYSIKGTTIPISLHTWYYVAVAWEYDSGTTLNHVQAWMSPIGGVFAKIMDENSYYGGADQRQPTQASVCDGVGTGGPYSWLGRVGGVSLCSIGSLADVSMPTNAVALPTTPTTWYCNPATGNDNNDGLSPATAWASISKINAEFRNGGIMGFAHGMAGGDALVIDGTTTSLDLGAAALEIKRQGAKVTLIGSEPIKAWREINRSWALSSGCVNTYETTDSGSSDLTGIVVWEDDKWMNHPTGSNFAAVKTSMESTAGSFYSDGTKIYLHPFDDTNPATDGKIYTRSRYRTANSSSGGSAILVEAPDVLIDAITPQAKIWKTCLARSTDNDPYNGYILQWDGGSGGSNKVSNLTFDYWSKHGEGRTCAVSNMFVTRENITYGQGSTYAGFGGQTGAVDYAQGTGVAGNGYLYKNCRQLKTSGLIGSTDGQVLSGHNSWVSHGSYAAFSSGAFEDCYFASGITEYASNNSISLLRSTVGGGVTNCTVIANQCVILNIPIAPDSGTSATMRNCILKMTGNITNVHLGYLYGTIVMEGCVVDFQGNPSGAGAAGLWGRKGPCSVTVRNTLILSDAVNRSLLFGFRASDTLVFANNAYANGASTVVFSYNDGSTISDRTLDQWQTLGKDANSFLTTPSAAIGTDYRPIQGSPLINAGVDLGPLTDFSGIQIFSPRNDIGVFQSVNASLP